MIDDGFASLQEAAYNRPNTLYIAFAQVTLPTRLFR